MSRQHLHEFFTERELDNLCIALAERANRQFSIGYLHRCPTTRKEGIELDALRARIRTLTKPKD